MCQALGLLGRGDVVGNRGWVPPPPELNPQIHKLGMTTSLQWAKSFGRKSPRGQGGPHHSSPGEPGFPVSVLRTASNSSLSMSCVVPWKDHSFRGGQT